MGRLASYGLSIAPDDTLFVADGRANRVQKLSPDGTVLAAWGVPGARPGDFRLPHGIAVDADGAVYVTEIDGKRVQKFVPPAAQRGAEPGRATGRATGPATRPAPSVPTSRARAAADRPKSVEQYQAYAMTHQGDAGRGKALFLDDSRLACGRCRAVDGNGDRAGPDLFAIGDKFGRRDLIEAVLRP